jgi:hypothetical protein
VQLSPKTIMVAVVLGLVIVLIALRMVVGTWQIAVTRRSEAALTGGQEYRGLAEEYRRLAEMAITAQLPRCSTAAICLAAARTTGTGRSGPSS